MRALGFLRPLATPVLPERLLPGHDIKSLRDLPAKGREHVEDLFKINGARLIDALRNVDPGAHIAWQRKSDALPSESLDWSLALYQANETAPASDMLTIWLNRTGGLQPLPR